MPYDGEPDYGICSDCGEECHTVRRDLGFGAYEYWGARGTHHDWRQVSPCREAKVVPGGCFTLSDDIRTARKTYTAAGGPISPGERYRCIISRHWRMGGPSWITTRRIKLPAPSTVAA